MALYDTADLVSRFRRIVKRPSTDGSLTPDDIYRYLSDGQQYVMRQLSVFVPAANRKAKEKLTTPDDGKTYELSKEPIGPVDVYANKSASRPLSAGEAWNHGADFEWDGLTTIRMIGDRSRTFNDGPWAHYTPVPPDIDASTQPTLVPSFARVLIPYAAAIQYASEGAMEDPTTYKTMYDDFWSGDPHRAGDIGILGELKQRFSTSDRSSRPWWRSPDLSDLPIGFNS